MLRAWASLALIMLMTLAAGGGQDLHAQTAAAAKPTSQAASDKKQTDPAQVQNALDQAAKALEGGKADQAVQRVNAVLASGRLQSRSMAQALYVRGSAYHKQGKPAQAIADLTSALWLKGGLSDADRAAATALRSQAYRDAGLADLADADARKATRDSGTATTTSARSWQTDISVRTHEAARKSSEPKTAAVEPNPAAATSLTGFFSNLFGAGSGSRPAAPDPGIARRDAAAAGSSGRQPSVGEAWSTSIDAGSAGGSRQTASVRQETAALPAPDASAKPAAPARGIAGQYRLQVAATRGRSEAQAVLARLKKEHADVLAGREAEIDETVIGNMGTFYRVRIGPFAEAREPRALCPRLRDIGLDCLIMAQ